MSAPAEPLRLLLLADTPDWAPLLGERLRALGPAFSLSIVTTWEGAATLFAAEPRGLLLATPACLPLGTPCPWPVILLLQQEPAQAPVGVVDWLAAEQLSEDSLRRCLRYARERLGLQATLQLLAEQDPLTGIANRQGFQTLLAARLSEFDGRGLEPLHMAVNLSFRQFQDSQLLPTLQRLIEEHGVDARWLEFELTETAVMRRSDQVLQTMQALGQLGVRFSLDDFGTGFSSFVHLNSLPITLLKIDRSFVGGMDQRAENFQLVRAMINLAHNLNLEVVAEGVETLRQQEQLRDFGCDQVQGYWISPPLPLAELARFLGIGERSAHRGQPLGN
ncbi:TPA: GGDEF domain-containing protein [Pseudomonas aeruginosa]|nr:GGDEF domain-containing protein [Pseudomonas aeruginosa]HCR1807598.1 GGDEF domain-containing protein [Pseudomonas aeruginosa]